MLFGRLGVAEDDQAAGGGSKLLQVLPDPCEAVGVPFLPFVGIVNPAADDVQADKQHATVHEREVLLLFDLSEDREATRCHRG